VAERLAFNHPFARRQSISLVDAAREPVIGLTPEKYPRYQEYVGAIFACVNKKPRIVEKHDGWAGAFSAVAAGTDSDGFRSAASGVSVRQRNRQVRS
jgi:hypothetical protein